MSWLDNKCDLCGDDCDKKGHMLCTDRWTEEGKHSAVNILYCNNHNDAEVNAYVNRCYEANPDRNDDLRPFDSCSQNAVEDFIDK
jgi:hypothetical protein